MMVQHNWAREKELALLQVNSVKLQRRQNQSLLTHLLSRLSNYLGYKTLLRLVEYSV